jgi:hypothetical protein
MRRLRTRINGCRWRSGTVAACAALAAIVAELGAVNEHWFRGAVVAPHDRMRAKRPSDGDSQKELYGTNPERL